MKPFTTLAAAGLVAAATFTLAPQAASALSFRYDGQNNGFADVNFTRASPPGQTEVTSGARAGIFSMVDVTDPNNTQAFLAWCFDVDTNISTGPNTYTEMSGLLNSTPPYLAGAGDRLQRLFDSSYDPGFVNLTGSDLNAWSAGFQTAIWEVIYDDNFDITSGSFKINSGNQAARNKATGFLNAAKDYTGPQRWIITTFQSETSQDLGVATPIPLPAAAWLLLAASGGLIAAKRRHARRAA